jgi:ketosteroid isomerase-like protein
MRGVWLCSIIAGLAACNAAEVTPADKRAESSALDSIMLVQQDAWNRADIEGFMQPYWKSDSLCFIGKRGLTFGWQNTLDNYKKGYPDAAAMGRLQFTNHSLDVLSDDHAYVIGKWELFRVADTLSGHYSLLWKKISGKWVIVADHSS